MRIVLIVIDSLGVGAMPDAHDWGDEGSNTFLHTFKSSLPSLPTMTKLGIKNIDTIDIKHFETVIGCYGKMAEITKAKDTTAGHYEMMGIVMENPYPIFPNGFPPALIKNNKAPSLYSWGFIIFLFRLLFDCKMINYIKICC